MQIAVDLHSHSGYSGGVGKINLNAVATTMALKGIDVFGTGDCLHPAWNTQLREQIQETSKGVYQLPTHPHAKFILQNEIVLTAPLLPSSRTRKSVHMVLLYPDFHATDAVIRLLKKYKVKNTIGRPFVKLESPVEVSRFLENVIDAAPGTLAFPAHVMTPDGIYGSHNPITHMEEFFGDFTNHILLIETGLSADPEMLDRIPECRSLNFISNSDCHSSALNRIGREFTCLNVEALNFPSIRTALTGTGITATYEFNPREGKYFGTGHRKGKEGHSHTAYRIKSGNATQKDCPVCGKPLTIGVMDRVLELARTQKASENNPPPARQFQHLIPLVEVIAAGLGQKSVSGKRVLKLYQTAIEACENEIALWQFPASELISRLKDLPEPVVACVLAVQADRFTFDPPGYDGEYGQLKIQVN